MAYVPLWRRRSSVFALFGLLSLHVSPARADEPAELVAPRLVAAPEPEYPKDEPARQETVTVVLTLEIDADGRVAGAVVTISGGARFDAAALAAAEKLEFQPARRAGIAIRSKIPFRFEFAPPPVEKPVTPALPPPPTAPAPVVQAAVAPAPATPTEIVDIDVRGERPPREVSKRTLQASELAHAPGTNGDALHAVENLPGVARGSGISGDIIVRGSAPQDTAVYLDGTWIPNAFHFGGVTSVVPTEMLERLDFYPGNFSPEYGRAMGGVIDVGARSPKKDRAAGLLQVDLLDARVLAEVPLSSKTRVLVAGRRSWIDTWLGPLLRSGGTPVSTAPVYYDYQAMIEHDLSESTTARLFFFGSDDRLAITQASPEASDPVGGNLDEKQSFFRLQGRLTTRFSDRVKWKNMVSWGEENASFQLGDIFFDGRYHVVDGRSEVRASVTRGLSVVAGIDVLAGHFDVRYQIPPQTPDGQAPGPTFAAPKVELAYVGSLVRPAAYALIEASPIESLKIIPGVRVDHTTDTGQWSVDPRIAVRWDVVPGFPRTTIKGGAGFFHQPPQFQEALRAPKPEDNLARHYGLGVEQDLTADVDVSVEGFYKDLSNLVVAEAAINAGGTQYTNHGSGRAYGAEALVRWKPGGIFSGFLSYTLSRSERKNAPDQPLSTFAFDQTHILNVLGTFALGRGWSLGGRFRYVTGNPYTPYRGGVVDFDAGAYAPLTSPDLNSARVSAFHSLDVRVEKGWTVGPVRLAVYVDVRNVYNHQNAEAVTYNYNYSQSQAVNGLPILPIVGVRGEL